MSRSITVDKANLNRGHGGRTRQRAAQQRFLRRRRRLAEILESALDPRYPLRHGVRAWPRIPSANRAAVAEPLQHIVALLRDPRMTIAERTLRRVLAFLADPTSPAYGEYPRQAGFMAYSLVDEVRTHTVRLAAPVSD